MPRTKKAGHGDLAQPHRIIVVVEGGLIQDIVGIPSGVKIEVRDFDVEGTDPEYHELKTTLDGEEYVSSVWEPIPEEQI